MLLCLICNKKSYKKEIKVKIINKILSKSMKIVLKNNFKNSSMNKICLIKANQSKDKWFLIILNKLIKYNSNKIRDKSAKIMNSKTKLISTKTKIKKSFKRWNHSISQQYNCKTFKRIFMMNILKSKKWQNHKLNNIANNFKLRLQGMMSLNLLWVLVIWNLITVSNKLLSNNSSKNLHLYSLKPYLSH